MHWSWTVTLVACRGAWLRACLRSQGGAPKFQDDGHHSYSQQGCGFTCISTTTDAFLGCLLLLNKVAWVCWICLFLHVHSSKLIFSFFSRIGAHFCLFPNIMRFLGGGHLSCSKALAYLGFVQPVHFLDGCSLCFKRLGMTHELWHKIRSPSLQMRLLTVIVWKYSRNFSILVVVLCHVCSDRGDSAFCSTKCRHS